MHGAACAGAKFDFISYMRESMEDDYGKLVGLGLPMWLFLIFFVLLSSVWGAPASLGRATVPQTCIAKDSCLIAMLIPRVAGMLGACRVCCIAMDELESAPRHARSMQKGGLQAKLWRSPWAAHQSPDCFQLILHFDPSTHCSTRCPFCHCTIVTASLIHGACALAVNVHMQWCMSTK